MKRTAVFAREQLRAPFTVAFFADRLVIAALVAGVLGAGPWMADLATRLLARAAAADVVAVACRAAVVATLTMILAASALFIAANAYSPFIYFRF